MLKKSTDLCLGCRDNFYNGNNPMGVKQCWMFPKAKVVVRYKIGWWTKPTQPGAYEKVETLNCHHATGKYALHEKLPSFAVDCRNA